MARYIDADKQIERYSKKLGFYIDEEGEDRFSAKCEEIRAAITALYNAPTADVAEVVRCKDCKYWQDNNNGYPHEECRWGKDETPDTDDYCSYGKKVE